MRLHRGFTIIETIVVIAAIAILAGILTPTVLHQVKEAKRKACAAQMDNLRTAIINYARDYGFRPVDEGHPTPEEIAVGAFPRTQPAGGNYTSVLSDDLAVIDDQYPWDPVTQEGWNGPYIDPGPSITIDADGNGSYETIYAFRADPWGRYFLYVNYVEGDTRSVILLSSGPDLTLLTDDDLYLPVYAGPLF